MPLKPINPFFAAMLFGMGVCAPLHDLCAQALNVQVRAGVHDDYERLVIDWPKQVPFTFSQNGSQVVLRFSAQGMLDLSTITRQHLTTITQFEQTHDADASTIILFLKTNTVANAVQDKGKIIIDMRAGKPPVAVQPAATPPAPAHAAQPATLIASEAPVAEPIKEPVHEPAPPEPVKVTPEKPAFPVIAPPSLAPAVEVKAKPLPVTEDPQREQKKNSTPDLTDIGDSAVPLVALDPGIAIGAAVYRRADFVYIVFSKKMTLPLTAMLRDQPRVALEALQTPGGSVFRFYMPQDLSLRCVREENRWTVFASKQIPTARVSLTLIAQPDYALGPRILLPISSADEPVQFLDPELGDMLIIVPLSASGQAVRQPYRYADFHFVPSEQGIVIQPHVDGMNVKRQSLGVEITKDTGLRLSLSRDTGLAVNNTQTSVSHSDYVFDLNEWYGPSNKTFIDLRQHWQRTLAEVPMNERDRVRLNIVRFLFARNHAEEAMGLLNLLSQQVPDLLRRNEFIALRGAIKVLMRDTHALDDLAIAEFTGTPEIQLWRAVAQAHNLEWKAANDLFIESDAVLQNYLEPFFTDFSLIAAEAAIASKDKQYAAHVLERLIERHPEMDATSGALNYLRGMLMNLTDHLERAEQYWRKAAALPDRLYQVRARLSLADYQVITGKISPAKAAEQLERVRFAWRGDDMELDILRRIGKFYLEGGKTEEGLSTLKQALVLLPDNEAAKKLHEEMAFAFRDVFLGDKSKTIPALDALSLYERFYELAPPGEAGDAIIRSLAQRMVSLDLLDRGAMLLADQARNRLSGALKTRIGTQAAGIYLLDRKADAALSILKDTDDPAIADDLATERSLLKAKALSMQGNDEDAKTLLRNIKSEYATRLLVDMAWHNHDWANAAEILDGLIGAPPANGESVKLEMAPWVINRAIALALINDNANLEKLHSNFGAAMKATPQTDLFKMLTEPDTALPRDPTTLKSLIADVDLFQPYLENYRNLN